MLLLLAAIGGTALADQPKNLGIGKPITEAQIAPWNIDVVGLTGAGLPPGKGSVAEGTTIWESKCASCHGVFGEGAGKFPVIAGGAGSLKADTPEKTVGSYWPYAPTLFDYIKRAMPFYAPQSLTDHEVYALTAYVLNLNDIVPKTAVLDASTLAAIKMPNRDGFIRAEWDTKNVACMSNCKPGPAKISSDLVSLHVTPDEKEAGSVGSSIDIGEISAAENKAAASPAPPVAGKVAIDVTAKSTAVSFAQVAPIIAQRCTACHGAKPTVAGFSTAPMGIKFDTPAEIKAQVATIKSQSVTSHQMPLGNMTHMTDAERTLIGKWIAAGASLK
ncbi:MAG: hypothetical protein NVSMB5_08740 [Candidatus Velthaea sp.]